MPAQATPQEYHRPDIWLALDPGIRAAINRIHATLRDAGHRCYLVGGGVRDLLLKRPAYDIDLTGDAPPNTILRLFRRVIPTGIRHGTVTIVIGDYGFEYTTFRAESGHSDGRRPDSVSFTESLREDIIRRDFTINGLAYDIATQQVIDYTGGVADLGQRLIRAIGDAELRFREDGLRAIRALRFRARLDFRIDEATLAAIAPTLEVSARVAIERVFDEWQKAAAGDYARFLADFYGHGFWRLFIAAPLARLTAICGANGTPGFSEFVAALPAFFPRARAPLSGLSDEAATFLTLVLYTCLGIFGGRPPAIDALRAGLRVFFRDLKRSAETARSVEGPALALLYFINKPPADSPAERRRYLSRVWQGGYAREWLPALREMLSRAISVLPPALSDWAAWLELIAATDAENPVVSLDRLAIHGQDIQDLGWRGRDVGVGLQRALEMVLADPDANRREKLLAALRPPIE